MAGHIQLGKYADTTLRDYVLENETRLQAATANPYAARVSTGGPYAQLDTFNDWTIQDWHTGVGNKDPDNGQLFSLAETRYPNYLMPSLGWEFPLVDENQAQSGTHVTTPTEFSLLSSKKYSVSVKASFTGNWGGVWVYVHCPYAKVLTVELRSDSTGAPGSVLKTATITSTQTRVHAHWVYAAFASAQAVTTNTRYHITVSSNVSATLGNGVYPYMPTVVMSGAEKCYSSTNGGTTWALEGAGTTGFYYLLTYYAAGTNEVKGAYVTSNGKVFLWIDDVVYEVNSGLLTEVDDPSSTIYDVMQVGNLIYISIGSSGYRIYDAAAFSTDTSAAISYMLRVYGGYLWRSNGNTVAYSADGTLWTTLDDFSNNTSNDITGMAGMGGYMYAATAEGLFQVADGDQVVQIVQWPEVHADNGKNMIAWENALYIPMYGGSIMRYGADGALLNVGINAKEELPEDLQGTVVCLKATNYFLMAVVEAASSTGYSSLWSYNVDGWHCLSLAPQGIGGGAVATDRENDYMYWGMDRAVFMRTDYPASINNPARNMDSSLWARESWVEYDRFYGGYRTLLKDFDRIYIDTENPGRQVHVYWQTEDHYGPWPANHDGEVSWQYLGTLATGESTISFPATSRPVGKSFRLALRITITDADATADPPVLRGVSVKYSTNVADRWRWVLPILVSDNQQMPDGSINEYTAAQQEAHLLELIAETAPLRYVDAGGVEYTVKVTGASRNILRYDWLSPEGEPSIQYIYMITIEQVS